jgi:glucan phosphoethanolaminetransferase (alkaline phosphatase superfamily)
LLFVTWVLVLNKLKDKKVVYYTLLSLLTFYLVFSILGSYIFFYFNGFYPNYYTYEYFKNEPLSAFVLLKDTIKLQDAVMFTLGFVVVFYLLRKLTITNIKWNSWKKIALGAVVYLGVFAFLVVKVKKYDQCLMVDTNFSAAVNRHIFDWEKQRTFKGKGLGARTIFPLQKTDEKRDFNVLVVVFESLRKQNLEAYGYSRKTTPNFRKFQQQHPEEFFVFKNPYTVSSTTMLAVPSVLTGIGPYQSADIFYGQPIMWDYGNMLNYRTFFITSHSLKWYRFDRFYAKEKLDHLWYKEVSGHPFFNDLGIDDAKTIDHLNEVIQQPSDDPFFGIVQLNATHYPYTIPKEFVKWKGTFLDEYDNSIYYQDHVMGKLFDALKRSGKLKNTIIVFTSDHGESLKDHNNIGHVDSYYAETISVPLMLYLPKGLAAKYDVKTLKSNLNRTTSSIDIAPTIVELLGLKKNASVQEVAKNFTGQSLFKPIRKDRAIITMNNNEIARFKVGISLIRDNYHYIYRTNIVPNRQEVYDIKKDKNETKNLIDKLSKKQINVLMKCFEKYPASMEYIPKKD